MKRELCVLEMCVFVRVRLSAREYVKKYRGCPTKKETLSEVKKLPWQLIDRLDLDPEYSCHLRLPNQLRVSCPREGDG